jgi:hypothetical protein
MEVYTNPLKHLGKHLLSKKTYKKPRFNFIFKFINHVRAQAALDREHG